jgi:hypothetical protein
MSWAQRLKRVFAVDIEGCPDCGGKLRVIASIEDPQLIAKILAHLRARQAATVEAVARFDLDGTCPEREEPTGRQITEKSGLHGRRSCIMTRYGLTTSGASVSCGETAPPSALK